MKSLVFICFCLLAGYAYGGELELTFEPNLYSVVEGGTYEVFVEIVNGTVEENQFFVVKASYQFGKGKSNYFTFGSEIFSS